MNLRLDGKLALICATSECSGAVAAITFLASPVAGYINGINLPVDGGRIQSL